jgi:hypothetical protein
MENEKIETAQQSNRDVSNAKPEPTQDCSDVVNISVFFDGTGNNRNLDLATKSWSNPARLYSAVVMHPNTEKNSYPIYISGVGTPFNGTATGWVDSSTIKVQDVVLGNAAGAGGTRRTEFGQENVNRTLQQVLFNNAKKLGLITKTYGEQAKTESLGELSKALSAHRLIKVINISIFGFSRGAALARAFINDLIKGCEINESGALTYQSYPVRIHFMGLFDTVASFGFPSTNMDNFFTEKNLKIPGMVENCVHFVAAHELRFSFPVDLISQNGKLLPNWKETIYPGVHSDVGGGYEPLSQNITNNYARIPMRDMMVEAVKAGVRMLPYNDIEKSNSQQFSEQYKIEATTQESFDRYMATISIGSTPEQTITAHMKALYSVYGTMTRRGVKTPDMVQAEGSAGHTILGHGSMAREAGALQDGSKAAEMMGEQLVRLQVLQFIGSAYTQVVRPEPWRLEAWNATANDDVVGFIKDYVHDSKAGFIMSVEPFSYFRPRGMTEASRNVLAVGLQWMESNVEAAAESVVKVYHSAEGVAAETWKEGKQLAVQTYAVGEKFAVETLQAGEQFAVEVYQTGKDVVISTAEAGQQVIVTSIDVAQKEAASILAATQEKAAAIARRTGELAKQAANGIGETVDAGMSAVEQGWKSTRTTLGF